MKNLFHNQSAGENQSIQVQNQPVSIQNQKTVNQFWIRLQRGLPVAHLYDEIRTIANQCPSEGGNAVYQARILLYEVDSILPTEYPNTCLQQRVSQESVNFQNLQKPISAEFGVQIYPNPAKEFLTIRSNENARFEVFNQLGAILKTGNILEEETQLSVSDLQSGIYWIRIISETGTPKVQTIQIIR